MDLDVKDVKLLEILEKDGRKPLRSIAKELDVSTVTVLNRMKKLKREGVLKGFTAQVDPIKAGYKVTAVINLTAKRKHLVEVQEKLAKFPNVCGVYDVTGQFDSVIIARFRDMRALNKFVKEKLSMEWVDKTHTQVALNIFKEDFSVNL